MGVKARSFLTERENMKKIKIEQFLIKKEDSVKTAMKKMDEVGLKVLFVVDDDFRLQGSLTDGDIRRWILAEGSLVDSLEKVFHKKPSFLKEGYGIQDAKKIMVDRGIEGIPIVDEENRVIDALLWKDIFAEKTKKEEFLDVPVVIMSGGQGLRLEPFTKVLPKPLIPINDTPIIEIIMNHFAEYTRGGFTLIVGHKGGMIKSYLDNANLKYPIHYLWEKKPLGTAGGLKLLPKDFPDNFFISNCDILVKAAYDDIYNSHITNNNDMTIVVSVKHFKIPYGVIELANGGVLKKITEKPEYDLLVNTGLYVVNKKVVKLFPKRKHFHTTDLIEVVSKNAGKIGVYPISEKSWFDVGQWEEYKKVVSIL